MGYSEFELDIPEVMRRELPKYFDNQALTPLTVENIQKEIPEGAQGAYMLFLDGSLVYIGKTDSKVGFRNRLGRHLDFVRHRRNLDHTKMGFKAVRIFVFSTFDLESMLIEEYSNILGARPAWNFSGFGSNDPGHKREGQEPADFDMQYPVDIDEQVDFLESGPQPLIDMMKALKRGLPYTFRYGTGQGTWHTGHPDMRDRTVNVPTGEMTTRAALQMILDTMPDGWQATVLPNRVILYKEKETYQYQVEALRKAGS